MSQSVEVGANGAGGIFQTIKAWVNGFEWVPIQLQGIVGLVLLGFGIAFVMGFLFRKYYRLFLGFIIFLVIIGVFLESQQIVIVNWEQLGAALGIDFFHFDFRQTLIAVWAWIKGNVALVGAMLTGFVIGFKLG